MRLETTARIACMHCKKLVVVPKKISTANVLAHMAAHCEASKAAAATQPKPSSS